MANTAGASAVYLREQMAGLSELVSSYAQRPTMIAAMRRSRHTGPVVGVSADVTRPTSNGCWPPGPVST